MFFPDVHFSPYFAFLLLGGDFDALMLQSPRSGCKGFSELATHCVAGHHRKVKQILERNSTRNGKSLHVLIQLLETRETILRFTPLMLVFCRLRMLATQFFDDSGTLSTKKSSGSIQSMKSIVNVEEGVVLEQNLLKVVVLLLQYGSNPNAKDVTGRTVCFYGAGIHATETSMAATTMCIGAATSAQCFGKEIVLREMDDSSYNGMRGLAAGYQAETGRRIVYLFGRKTEIAVMNRNIRLIQDPFERQIAFTIPPPKNIFNLCNVQFTFFSCSYLSLSSSCMIKNYSNSVNCYWWRQRRWSFGSSAA